MAKTNFQQMMSDPSTPVYVNPGVAEAPSALPGFLADAAQVGVAAYEGTQLRNQRLAVDEAINQFENYTAIEDLTMDELAGQRNAADSIWKQYEDQVIDTDTAALNKLEETYGKSIEKLKRAQEQGVLNDSEFLARVTKITREAVNKNPWMEAELYSSAQTHLKAMGISDLLDTRAKSAKNAADQQDEARKFYRSAFEKRDMLDAFNPNGTEVEWQAQLQGIIQEEFGLSNGRRILEAGKQQDEAMIRRMVSGGKAMEFHNTDIKDITTQAMKTLQADPRPETLDAVISNLRLVGEERVRNFRATLGTAALTTEGKAIIADIEKDWKETAQILVDAGTAKNGTDMLKNALEARKAVQGLQLRTKVNPEQLDLAVKVMTGFGESIKDQMTKLGLPALENATGLVSTLMMGEGSNQMELGNAITSGSANAIFSGILSNQKGYATREGITALNRTASAVNQFVAAQKTMGETQFKQSLPAVNGLLKTVAENAAMLKGQPSDPEFARNVKQSADIAMGHTVPELMRVISKVAGPTDNIELDVLPNGSFVINTGDPSADEKFNKKFSNQINNALDAYAAANGKTREQIAPEFYNTYLKNYVNQDPELKMLTPGELNIQSPREAKAALDTGRITQQEYDAILKEGFN